MIDVKIIKKQKTGKSRVDLITPSNYHSLFGMSELSKKVDDLTKMWQYDPDNPDAIRTPFGVWSEQWISALGMNTGSGGGSGSGGAVYDRLDSWSSYDEQKAGYVLSAALGQDLHLNKLDKADASALYQPKGDYVTLSGNQVIGGEKEFTEIVKLHVVDFDPDVEHVLGWYSPTGNITHFTLPSLREALDVYSKQEADAKYALASDLSGYLPLTGGTLTGFITIKNAGVTMWIGPMNAGYSHMMSTKPFYFDKYIIITDKIIPNVADAYTLGDQTQRWKNVFATTINVTSSARVNNLNADLLDGMHLDEILNSNVASASRLQTEEVFTAWGQLFFANGVPQSLSGALTDVGNIVPTGHGEQILGAWGNNFAEVYAGAFQGRLDQPLVIRQYKNQPIEFYTNAIKQMELTPTGELVTNRIKIGDVMLSYDSVNNCLMVSGGGVLVEKFITALKTGTQSL